MYPFVCLSCASVCAVVFCELWRRRRLRIESARRESARPCGVSVTVSSDYVAERTVNAERRRRETQLLVYVCCDSVYIIYRSVVRRPARADVQI